MSNGTTVKSRSWRTTLGGALTSMGTTLIGVGVVPQLTGMPSVILTRIAVTGFICQALGQFFSQLFAADSAAVDKAINGKAEPSPNAPPAP